MGRVKPNPFAMQPGQVVSSSVIRRKAVQDPLAAAAELIRLRQRIQVLEEVLKTMIGLASGLNDDDPWFGEQRNAEHLLAGAKAVLEEKA